jgi:uncharacterized membrane protein
MSHWYFQPIFDNYLAVGILSAVLLLLLLMPPRFGRISNGQRMLLGALRAVVIGLVALAMLRPTHVSTKSRFQEATLILLMDQSRSMSVADSPGGSTRWQRQWETVQSVLPMLAELAQRMDVRLYAFDSAAHAVEFDRDHLELEENPVGDQSDIGSSLDDVMRHAAGRRLAGMILLSDGKQRALAPRVDIQDPARELARLGYPLYTIAMGVSRDQAQARDVEVQNLPDQYTVFVKNELEINALVRAQGYVNQELPVELVMQSSQAGRETFGPISVRPTLDGQQLPVRFTYTPERPGQYKLTVQVAAQAGELVTGNNQLSAFLSVLEGGLRVLYLYGSIVSGQRLECESIASSSDIQLDHMWIDKRRRDLWPVDLAKQLSDSSYDVFMLGDLDSTALGNENCAALAKAVDQGKGLIMLGGYHSFGPGGYGETPLANVLPIQIGRFERQQFDAPRRADLHLNRKISILPTRPHFITHLAPGDQNPLAWRSLPPLVGANKFTGLKERNVQVLAESASGDPILVAGVYGQGRVLALAAESTSAWYRYGFQSQHKRFWRQAILWLAHKEESLHDGVWVKLDQRRLAPGGSVAFAVGARSPDGDALMDVTFDAHVMDPGGARQPARLVPDGQQWKGRLEGTRQPGEYVLEVVGQREGAPFGSAQGKFMVLDQDLELSDPAADPQQLEQLARLTAQAGGKALAPEQLGDLLREIKNKPPEMETQIQSKWQLADTPLDAWLFFLCVVGLLSGEWFLRKRWRLV